MKMLKSILFKYSAKFYEENTQNSWVSKQQLHLPMILSFIDNPLHSPSKELLS